MLTNARCQHGICFKGEGSDIHMHSLTVPTWAFKCPLDNTYERWVCQECELNGGRDQKVGGILHAISHVRLHESHFHDIPAQWIRNLEHMVVHQCRTSKLCALAAIRINIEPYPIWVGPNVLGGHGMPYWILPGGTRDLTPAEVRTHVLPHIGCGGDLDACARIDSYISR